MAHKPTPHFDFAETSRHMWINTDRATPAITSQTTSPHQNINPYGGFFAYAPFSIFSFFFFPFVSSFAFLTSNTPVHYFM